MPGGQEEMGAAASGMSAVAEESLGGASLASVAAAAAGASAAFLEGAEREKGLTRMDEARGAWRRGRAAAPRRIHVLQIMASVYGGS